MARRKIIKIHKPERDDIGNLVTNRVLPTESIEHLDPFLFLNHHGPQIYPPHNNGLPFAPHPHRGFETVTFIYEGDIAHRDSSGHESVIRSGGVQWMTAGRGIEHEEVSSEDFKNHGGPLEILQLWVNLPSKLKMTKPRYIGLQSGEIPHLHEGRSVIDLVSGTWAGTPGAVTPLTDITLMSLHMEAGAELNLRVDPERSIFFYVVRGDVDVNDESAPHLSLVQFDGEGEDIKVRAEQKSLILFGHAVPFAEPIVAHGPFVMNTREQIIEAIRDYQAGRFGSVTS